MNLQERFPVLQQFLRDSGKRHRVSSSGFGLCSLSPKARAVQAPRAAPVLRKTPLPRNKDAPRPGEHSLPRLPFFLRLQLPNDLGCAWGMEVGNRKERDME